MHQFSARKHGPYVAVNCGAIPEGTIDSELFGHEKGAFTGATETRKGYFEEANGGTIFLDEVAELPLTTQVRLLRVLETGEFMKVGSSKVQKTDVRVVAATNVDFDEAIAKERFREDLYYRLNVIEIPLLPLSARQDDIMPLAHHFLPNREFSYAAENSLTSHTWPGNVRELENICKRVAVLKPDGVIEAKDFALESGVHVNTATTQEPTKQQLEHAMREHQGVIARVARQFGLSRQALYRRLSKHGIEY